MKYSGAETKKALANFPFAANPVAKDLIYAVAEVKIAAARANLSAKTLEQETGEAIVNAGEALLIGKFDEEFKLSSVQGGAGTSINMQVNEIIASYANELLKTKGRTRVVHPNDHVNLGQSTNDVNPTALKILSYRLCTELLMAGEKLVVTFAEKAMQYKNVKKLARTHWQDATPTTLGAEFEAYSVLVERNLQSIRNLLPLLEEINLGGSAIGNSINVDENYLKYIYPELQKISGVKVRPAANLMSLTGSSTDFCQLSSAVNILFTELSKIATDLRFLASGPRGGIAEISLEAMQSGSSIMPGKVNPVIPEAINQVSYIISGKNLTIHEAAAGANLELSLMFPVIADSTISILKLACSAIEIFNKKCIATLSVNEENCTKHLDESTAYATLLTPKLGYDLVSALVKEAIHTGKTFKELVIEKGYLSKEGFEKLTASSLL